MVYGYWWELQSWAITLYMSTFNRVRGFRNVSFLVVFFTETAFDIVQKRWGVRKERKKEGTKKERTKREGGNEGEK